MLVGERLLVRPDEFLLYLQPGFVVLERLQCLIAVLLQDGVLGLQILQFGLQLLLLIGHQGGAIFFLGNCRGDLGSNALFRSPLLLDLRLCGLNQIGCVLLETERLLIERNLLPGKLGQDAAGVDLLVQFIEVGLVYFLLGIAKTKS